MTLGSSRLFPWIRTIRRTIVGATFILSLIVILQPASGLTQVEIDPSVTDSDAGTRIRDSIQVALNQESGQIRDGQVVFGKSVTVRRDETLKDSLVVFGGSADIKGNVDGDVIVFGGNATISGMVSGDVVILGGSVDLKATAMIDGSVLYLGGTLTRDDGAVVTKDPIHMTFAPDLFRIGFVFNTIAVVWWGFISFLLSLLFSRNIERTAHTMLQDPIRGALAGFLFHAISLAVIILLIVIIIGIPLSLFAFLAWFLTCLFAVPAGFAALGRWIYQKMNRPQTSILITCLTGFIILSIFRFLPYFIGFFIWHAWAISAVGATILSRFGTMQPWFRPAQPTT